VWGGGGGGGPPRLGSVHGMQNETAPTLNVD
jgi:hypothetical protein